MIQYWDLDTHFDTALLMDNAVDSVTIEGCVAFHSLLGPFLKRFDRVFADYWMNPLKTLYDNPDLGRGFTCKNGSMCVKAYIIIGRIMLTITDDRMKNKDLTLLAEWPFQTEPRQTDYGIEWPPSRFGIQGIHCSAREAIEILRSITKMEISFKEDKKIRLVV